MDKKILLMGLTVLLLVLPASGQVTKYTCVFMSPKTCGEGTCPTGYYCGYSKEGCACLPSKVTTTTTTTTLPQCPTGCDCLTEAKAEAEFGNPERCNEDVCGYEYSQTVIALIKIPKYCFREGMTSVPETVTSMPELLPEGAVGCYSCKSCTDALKNGNKHVVVTRDLEDRSSTCIIFHEVDDALFDCQNHTISGFGLGVEFYNGIELQGSDGNRIQNCIIEGFGAGIATYSADRNIFLNNTIRSNVDGIWLGGGRIDNATREVVDGSNNNKVMGNEIKDNDIAIYLAGNRDTEIGGNMLCQNSVADIYTSPYSRSSGNSRGDNICDLIYNWNNDNDMTWCDATCTADVSTTVNTATGLQGALNGDYGTVELTGDVNMANGLSINASHVTLLCKGHRISGSGSGIGIDIRNKVNVELNDCVIQNFGTGVLTEATSHSRILSNTIKENEYGLVLRSGAMPSRGNTIEENEIKPNDVYGVYFSGDVWDNSLTDNNLGGDQYSFYTNARCDNSIDETNKGKSGKKIGYFHDQAGLNIAHPMDRDYSELILCNVRNSETHGVGADNTGFNSDGILVINSNDVELSGSVAIGSFHGIAVVNSTDIKLINNEVRDQQKDCISVEKSTGTEIRQGRLRGCDRGVFISLSENTKVKDMNITNDRIAGIQLYMSESNEIDGNTISRGSGPLTFKGIILEESSDGNTIKDNTVEKTQTGIGMDPTSDNNRLEDNHVCNNSLDVSNSGTDNTGSGNTCSRPIRWSDDGTRGCTDCCSPAIADLDGDGIDDACDCADMHQGYGETGTDCGGKCTECVECTWCDSKVEPLRIKGHPNDGYIDIVFVPEEDWRSNWTGFIHRVEDAIRVRFLELDAMSTRPIYTGYEDMYNFYAYTGGKGKATSDSHRCYNPEGPEGWLCIGCKGWLPGERKYFDWFYSCTTLCAATLGLACGCFAAEPDHFWEHASFADSVGIIYTDPSIRGCSGFGPTSHFQAEYHGRGSVIMHEAGHSLFALTDEYCGDTAYSRASSRPNVWNSLGDCQSTAFAEGWTDGNCTQIRNVDENGTVTCSKGKYRYDTDAGRADLMRSSGSESVFKEADIRRINHVFSNWPSGGSKGIISYIELRHGKMKGIISRVVPNHPDLGMWMSDFIGLTQSSSGEDLDVFSFSDPRISVAYVEGGTSEGIYEEETMFQLIIPMHDNVRWLLIFNGTTGELETSVDLGPAVWNYCDELNWTDEYCQTVDIDYNMVPDLQETDNWVPEERIVNKTFEDMPDLVIEPEESEGLEGKVEEEKEPEGLQDQYILIAAFIAICLLIFTLTRLKKKK